LQDVRGNPNLLGGGVATKKRGHILEDSSVQSKKSDSEDEPDDPFIENDEIKRKYRKQKRRQSNNR